MTSVILRAMQRFRSLADIQGFLEETVYSSDKFYRCPARVLVDRRAHCVDGALLAAAALRQLGYPPLVVDLRAHRDDDHVIAVFQRHGHWGAIAKSNVVGLRFRESVHTTLRELVMTYFESYYNLEGFRVLRSYSDPVDLSVFDDLDWEHNDDVIEPQICTALDDAPHHELMTPEMIAALHKIDKRSYDAGLIGADPEGLYKPT